MSLHTTFKPSFGTFTVVILVLFILYSKKFLKAQNRFWLDLLRTFKMQKHQTFVSNLCLPSCPLCVGLRETLEDSVLMVS